MKKNRMKAVLESIVQRDVPASPNLWPHIAERIERKNFMQTVRTRPALALFLVFLALALLSSVAYAIGKVTGYIPGVGIVDQSTPLRILAEPVVAEKDGLTVTILQLVADADHTFVAYSVDGIIVRSGGWPVCTVMPSLQLPDGSTLNAISRDYGQMGGQVGSVMEFEPSAIYASIPADVSNITINFPCILPENAGPKDWQIPLKLSPAPEDYVIPAVEIGATFVASNPKFVTTPTLTPDVIFTPEPYDPSFPATPTRVPNGSGLYLDRVIELADSYILVGNFTDAGDLPGPLLADTDPYYNLPRIQDASGNAIAYQVRADIQPEVNWGGVRYWAFEIPKPIQGPLTITLDHVDINLDHKAQLDIDTGPDPKPGQVWELNLPIHLDKYEYVIDSMEMVEGGYTFKYHSGTDAPEGVSLSISFVGHLPNNTSGRLNQGKTIVEYSDTITYSSPPPTGPLTLEFLLIESVPLKGPWTLTWTPPGK